MGTVTSRTARTGEAEGAETYRGTVRRLAGAQKAAASGAPAYSLLVNRRVGRLLAAWAYRRGLTPNAVTGISAVFTFTGIAMVATLEPTWWSGVAVWLALAIGYAFDSADGQVARLRGGGSLAGEWLDHVVDSFKLVSLHLAVLTLTYRHLDLGDDRWLLVPMGFVAVASVSFFTMILNDLLRRVHAARQGTPLPAMTPSRLRQVLVVPTDYGVLCLSFVLLGLPTVFFGVYTFLFVASAGHLLLALLKWYRDMTRLEQRRAA